MNENLRLVLRLHKDGHLNEDEAVSLIQGLTVKNEKNESFSSYADPIDLSGYKYGNLTTSSTNCSTTLSLPPTNTLSSNTYSSKAASTCGSTAISSVDKKCTASSSSGTITSTSASDSWKKKFAGLISKIGNR